MPIFSIKLQNKFLISVNEKSYFSSALIFLIYELLDQFKPTKIL